MNEAEPGRPSSSAAQWLGIVAGTVGTVAIILFILNGAITAAGLFAAGQAIFFGCWFWQTRRKWSMTLFILGGLILVSLLAHVVIQNAATTGPTTDQTAVQPTDSPNTAPGAPRYETEVTLPKGSAIDVDQRADVQSGQTGATGQFDMYFDPNGNFYASSDIHMYPAGLSPGIAYDKCAEFKDTHAATVPHVPAITKGVAWCFNTSEGRSSWAQVSNKTSTSVTIKIRVWEK